MLKVLAAMTLGLPYFLVVNAWLRLFGHAGIWRSWIPFPLFSLTGAVVILALLHWPITFFLLSPVWSRIDPALIESDPCLRGSAFLRHGFWPEASPLLARGLILTLVLVLNHFAVPALLQVRVFPAELWVRFNTTFDYAGALSLGWPLLLGPVLLLIFVRFKDWPHRWQTTSSFRTPLAGWGGVAAALGAVALSLSLVLPFGQLTLSSATWHQLRPAFAAGTNAAAHSVGFAAVTASVVLVLSICGWRWKWLGISWFFFLVPGVWLGIALIAIFDRPWLAGFYRSSGIVVFAYALRYFGPCLGLVGRAFRGADEELMEFAQLEGATAWQRLWHVRIPELFPQLSAAWYVTYLLCLWDVETLLLVVPPGRETLSLRIFNLLHYGYTGQVNALCLILLAFALAPLMAWLLAGRLIRHRAFFKAAFFSGPGPALLAATALLTGCSRVDEPQGSIRSAFFSHVEIIGSRGTGPGQFNKPRSLALDRADNLFVVDMTGRVQKFSPAGKFLASWQMPETDKGKPKGMDRDADGNIVVIEPHYARVNHFSPDGKSVRAWGQTGTNVGELFFPRAVAVNSRGELFVSEYGRVERVQKFSRDGRRCLAVFGGEGSNAGEFNRAEGLGIDKEDRLYVADSCNHRIQIFSPDGVFLKAYGHSGTGPGAFSYPYDVRVDSAGRQYVCEFGNSRIQIFDLENHSIEILGGPGDGLGQFSNPWSIALDSADNLYVADALNHRVQKFVRLRNGRDVVRRNAP